MATALDASASLRPTRWFTLALCGLTIAAGLWLYTTHNDNPVEFHPDEPGKVYQTITRLFNFKHPQLMLTSTRFVRYVDQTLSGRGLNPYPTREVIWIGRTLSAIFMATAIVLLTLTTLIRHGRLAAIACALLALITPQAIAAGHYMKEDAGLLMGLSLWWLAFTLHGRRPSRKTLVLLGVACGIAGSGKYIGLLTLPVTLIILAWPPPRSLPDTLKKPGEADSAASPGSDKLPRSRHALKALTITFCSMLAVFLIFNYRLLTQASDFTAGLEFEVKHMLTGHSRLRSHPLSPVPLMFLVVELTWPLLIAGLAGMVLEVRRFAKLNAGGRLLLLFPFGYLVLVQCASLQEPRYLLPITLVMIYFASAAIGTLGHIPPPRLGWPIGGAVLGGLLILPAAHAVTVLDDFAHDNRYALRQWMLDHVQPGEVVLRDYITSLPLSRDWPEAQFVVEEDKYAGYTSFAEMQQRGIDYIVICDVAYDRFFDPHRRPLPGNEADIAAIRERYRVLLEDTPPQFERKRSPGTFEFSNPAVSVYRLADVPRGVPGGE